MKAACPAPAEDLYISPLFRGRRAYVEASCEEWFVLSAKHGLTGRHEVLAPYDLTLTGASVRSKREWARGVLAQIAAVRPDAATDVFEIHAGSAYETSASSRACVSAVQPFR